MALAHIGPFEIQTSPHSTILTTDPEIHYDAYSDQLIFKLNRNRKQSFSMPVNDYVSLLYDDIDDETIGIQIDDFATYAVHEFEALAVISKVAGIEPRQPGDSALYRDGRVIRRVHDFTPDDEAQFKSVIRRIIDYTGGFDPEIRITAENE